MQTFPFNSVLIIWLFPVLEHGENSHYIMTDDELDHVQWELETLMSTGILRQKTIRDELDTFASMQFARSQHKLSKNPKLPTIVSPFYCNDIILLNYHLWRCLITFYFSRRNTVTQNIRLKFNLVCFQLLDSCFISLVNFKITSLLHLLEWWCIYVF